MALLSSTAYARLVLLCYAMTALLLPFGNAATVESFAYDVANAVIYGYPLALYVQTFYPVLQAKGANTIEHDRTTSTSDSASLVRPNANYVYSAMVIDLSSENVVITIPNITDGRSYVYPFYDIYGDLVAALGSATSTPPGDYLLRPASALREPGLTLRAPAELPNCSSLVGVVDFPGAYASMKGRLLLRNNGSDLDTVHRYQNETQARTVPRPGPPLAPRLTTSLLGNGSLIATAYSNPAQLSYGNKSEILGLLATLAPYNPPKQACFAAEVNATLQGAGIANGSFAGQSFNDSMVDRLVVANLERVFPQNEVYWEDLGRDWWNYKSYFSGDFHEAYGVRAIIAYIGYLEMNYTQAIYPEYLPKNGGELHLSGNESYIFSFSSRPPAQFWSVTLYGSDNYLVQNSLDRYSLGCTDNITYANGTGVYPDGQNNDQCYLQDSGSESFQILIQPADKSPPANWTSNWLPAQAGGGKFTVNFRSYGPSPAMTNGTYTYPTVTKQGLVL